MVLLRRFQFPYLRASCGDEFLVGVSMAPQTPSAYNDCRIFGVKQSWHFQDKR